MPTSIAVPLLLAAAEGGGGGLLSVDTHAAVGDHPHLRALRLRPGQVRLGPAAQDRRRAREARSATRSRPPSAPPPRRRDVARRSTRRCCVRPPARARGDPGTHDQGVPRRLRTELVAKARAEAEAAVARAREQIQRESDAGGRGAAGAGGRHRGRGRVPDREVLARRRTPSASWSDDYIAVPAAASAPGGGRGVSEIEKIFKGLCQALQPGERQGRAHATTSRWATTRSGRSDHDATSARCTRGDNDDADVLLQGPGGAVPRRVERPARARARRTS